MSVVDPSATATRVAKYLDALSAPLKMGNDARNIPNALTSTMQSVVSERPDLANAHFDFHSSNGSIQVTSKDLDASDISWLQGKLNGNTSLVASVKAFHDDAVGGYAKWSDADGTPLTASQSDAVSEKADGLEGSMSLFQSLGQGSQQYQMKDGDYKLADGGKMVLGHHPTTAAGFLLFAKGAQAAENSTSSFVSISGKTLSAARWMSFRILPCSLTSSLTPKPSHWDFRKPHEMMSISDSSSLTGRTRRQSCTVRESG